MEGMPIIFRSVFFPNLFSAIMVLIFFSYKQWMEVMLWIKIILYSLIISYIKGIMGIILIFLYPSYPFYHNLLLLTGKKAGNLIELLVEAIITGILFFILDFFTIYLFLVNKDFKKSVEISFWINAIVVIPTFTIDLLNIIVE